MSCPLCANRCRIPDGELGFCGLRSSQDGKLVSLAGMPTTGLVQWYHDSLPTNCVASWVCPGGAAVGHPRFSHAVGPEYGWKNLAVFYESCTFDCLFCQNWHFRRVSAAGHRKVAAADLAAAADERTSCICYFGGDPSSQMAHALAAAGIARRRVPHRLLRICWETNGYMCASDLERALAFSLESGGCLKFDLKCWTESLHEALTGVSNRPVRENFRRAAAWIGKRRDLPLITASTLLVSGYVTAEEVERLARFIAGLDPTIPYSLLAFHGDYLMHDLPPTSRQEAAAAEEATREAGLVNVRVGNLHLLR